MILDNINLGIPTRITVIFLGVWQGTRENRNGYWLRWWDNNGKLLLWGLEKTERLAAQLRAAGIEPET
jgi:hypothetical protein